MKNSVLLLFIILSFACVSKKKQAIYLDYKAFGDRFCKVADHLYAGTCEITNEEYASFIKSLRLKGLDSLVRLYDFDSTQWAVALGYNEPLVNYYHNHPAYINYPAVNISYEGAVAYCQWLTEDYNNSPKRKFKKVVFRLPTQQEWEFAARGGRVGHLFPWGGPYMRNSRGHWLANFTHVDETSAKDTMINGRRMVMIIDDYQYDRLAPSHVYPYKATTPAKSYFPNGYGLYNMAGNVSEMLIEKGRTKGGNWNSYGYYLRIEADDEFDGQMDHPSPYVGFRVFAEVVEK